MQRQQLVRVGNIDTISARHPLRTMVNRTEVVVFQIENEFFAVENNCPHQHFSVLHQGEIKNCTVTCPMHGWNFDLRTGNATNGNGRLRTFKLEVRGNDLWMEKPSEEESFSLF